MTKATIILPTTTDRGPLLEYSVGSILAQSEPSWELYIIADGAYELTRQTAKKLAAADFRIQFFDYPKHERRGETYRHELLGRARGEIVCYLCDRDLMLPNHLALMHELLQEVDFGHSLIVKPSPEGRFYFMGTMNVANPEHRRAVVAGSAGIPLSIAAHRMDAYDRLPHGWRTTPDDEPTDRYMWQQFLAQSDISAGARLVPTVIYLRRGKHPGLSTTERRAELESYYLEYCRAGGAEAYQERLNRQWVEDEAGKHLRLATSPFRRWHRFWSNVRGQWRPERAPSLQKRPRTQ